MNNPMKNDQSCKQVPCFASCCSDKDRDHDQKLHGEGRVRLIIKFHRGKSGQELRQDKNLEALEGCCLLA